MEFLFGIIALLLYKLDYTAGATEEQYQYIGCFKDVANNRDLREKAITFTDLKLDDCASECRKDGWAYAGLQNNEKCYCGPSYAAHGEAVLGACNYTCSDKSGECGGSAANSVYYTVKIDSVTRLQRTDVVHKDATNFESSRRICIQNGGDLSLLDSPDHVNSSIELAVKKNVKVQKMWFGLRRVTTGWYAWTDEKNTGLDKAVFDNFWKSTETWQNPCVVVKFGTSDWESTSCFAQFPFVCNQIPQATDDDSTPPSATDPPEEDNNLALLIVLPIFSICYGGSCLVYCIAKMYRNCKKKKKMQLEKEENFTEFEPDTKPTLPQAAPMAKNKTMPMPAPVPPPPLMPAKPLERAKTPLQQTNGAPPPKRGYTPASDSTAPSSTTPPDTRPATSQAVDLGIMSPGRAMTPAEEKTEKKRNKLLQNALKEARDRKKDRESKMGSRPDTGVSRPGSATATVINEQDNLPIPDKKKKKRKKRDSPDSGDSMTDLLGDDKKEEPQKMSIQDIMKVKMLMKDPSKRPRRIITV